jgi:hypothetical protein
MLKNALHKIVFVFLHKTQKNIGFPPNLACAHKMLICTVKFCSNFFEVLKCLFWWQEHMLPCVELDFRKTTQKKETCATFPFGVWLFV